MRSRYIISGGKKKKANWQLNDNSCDQSSMPTNNNFCEADVYPYQLVYNLNVYLRTS